jgi:hypothetical protein
MSGVTERGGGGDTAASRNPDDGARAASIPESKAKPLSRSFFGAWKGKKAASVPPVPPPTTTPTPPTRHRRSLPAGARPDAPLAARAAAIVADVGELEPSSSSSLGHGSASLVSWVVTSEDLRSAARVAAAASGATLQAPAGASAADEDDEGPSFDASPRAHFAVASPDFASGSVADPPSPPQWRLLLRVQGEGARRCDVALLLCDDFGAGAGGGGGGGGGAGSSTTSTADPSLRNYSFGSLVGCSARVEVRVVSGGGDGAADEGGGGLLQRAFFAGSNAEAGVPGARVRLPAGWGLEGAFAGGEGAAGEEEEDDGSNEQQDEEDDVAAAATAVRQLLRARTAAPATTTPAVVVAAAIWDAESVSLAPGAADADHAAALAALTRPPPPAPEGRLPPRLVRGLVPPPSAASSSSSSSRSCAAAPPSPSSAAPSAAAAAATTLYHGVLLPAAVAARLEHALSRSVVLSRAPLILVADGVLDAEECALLCGAAAAAGGGSGSGGSGGSNAAAVQPPLPPRPLTRSRVAHGGETPSRTSRSYFFQGAEALRALAVQVDRELLAFSRAAAARVGRGLGGGGGRGGGSGERLLERSEQLQVIAYSEGGFYRAHYDHRVGVTLPRHATVLAYLCDTPRGGATWFPNADVGGSATDAAALDAAGAGAGGVATVSAAAQGGGKRGGGGGRQQRLPTLLPRGGVEVGSAAEGGGVRVLPRRGRALVFWSVREDGAQDDRSLHSAEDVLEGEKWVVSRWMRATTR